MNLGDMPMSLEPEGSVTCWIDHLRAGDDVAAQRLWERYFHQLVRLARANLRAKPRGAVDEEDIALSAFDSFCRGTGQGRFPRLDDRDSLWRLLVTITARKVVDQVERECRSGDERPESHPVRYHPVPIPLPTGRRRRLDYATRYRPYAYDISANGDPDFNVKSFRTTNVVRLEYKPGSTLFWRGSRRAKTTPRPAASASGATSSPTAYKPSHSS